MSGLRHVLGNDFYDSGDGDNEQRHTITWPAVGDDDRDAVMVAVKASGFARGDYDGLVDGRRRRNGRTLDNVFAVTPAHILWHCETFLRRTATTVSATGLSVATLRRAWMEGYEQGFLQNGGLSPQYFMMQSPEGEQQ